MAKRGLIGIQMMMLKGKVEELGAYETLKQCAEMGYHSVEISQIPMTEENVSEIKRACQDFSIKVAAMSASLEPMMPGMPGEFLVSDFDKIVKDCKTLDCSFLRIGMLPLTSMGSRDKALDFVKRTDEMAERLAEHGIELYYHNHHVEFVKYEGQYLLDIIAENTKYMGFELDVHWIHRGGEDPVKIIKRYAGRVKLIHLKDFRISEIDLTGVAEDRSQFMRAFSDVVQFAELGQGNLPLDEIIQAGLEAGSLHFLVEQDDTYGRDPFDCLRDSRDHLYELGYKEWFDLPQ